MSLQRKALAAHLPQRAAVSRHHKQILFVDLSWIKLFWFVASSFKTSAATHWLQSWDGAKQIPCASVVSTWILVLWSRNCIGMLCWQIVECVFYFSPSRCMERDMCQCVQENFLLGCQDQEATWHYETAIQYSFRMVPYHLFSYRHYLVYFNRILSADSWFCLYVQRVYSFK